MTDLYLRDLVPIVELQALELKRLMRDKERLNQKVESLISEISALHLLQQQDQTLRAREQDLRAKMQQALVDLVSLSGQEKEHAPIVAAAQPVAKTMVVAKPVVVAVAGAKSTAGAPQQRVTEERMAIPAFLAGGPRVGFDRPVGGNIREIHGPGGAVIQDPGQAGGEAPIKRLLTRIRVRNGTL